MDYILIGRDWQEEFKLTFEAERMIIEAVNGLGAVSGLG